MPSQAAIDQQLERLATYRRTLAQYLRQRDQLGTAYEPPGLSSGIREARAGIARCTATRRGWGVAVADHPDDEEATPVTVTDDRAKQRARDHAILEYIGRIQGQSPNQATGVEEEDISRTLHLKPNRTRASLKRLARAGSIQIAEAHDGMSAWITDEGWEVFGVSRDTSENRQQTIPCTPLYPEAMVCASCSAWEARGGGVHCNTSSNDGSSPPSVIR